MLLSGSHPLAFRTACASVACSASVGAVSKPLKFSAAQRSAARVASTMNSPYIDVFTNVGAITLVA